MGREIMSKVMNSLKRYPGIKKMHDVYCSVLWFIKKMLFRMRGATCHSCVSYNVNLVKALETAKVQSDFSDHLSTVFYFAAESNPKLIVELGTLSGESTRALLAAASISNATVLSVDIGDCSHLNLAYRDRWHFIQADDVEFGKCSFEGWCLNQSIAPVIDVLFIDTSHLYEHTVNEIEVWFKYLSDEATIIFHDTNLGAGIYSRTDGSIGCSWDNERGVIRAIEEFLGRQYNEKTYFCDITDNYSIMHFPNCCGLTIIRKRKRGQMSS